MAVAVPEGVLAYTRLRTPQSDRVHLASERGKFMDMCRARCGLTLMPGYGSADDPVLTSDQGRVSYFAEWVADDTPITCPNCARA